MKAATEVDVLLKEFINVIRNTALATNYRIRLTVSRHSHQGPSDEGMSTRRAVELVAAIIERICRRIVLQWHAKADGGGKLFGRAEWFGLIKK